MIAHRSERDRRDGEQREPYRPRDSTTHPGSHARRVQVDQLIEGLNEETDDDRVGILARQVDCVGPELVLQRLRLANARRDVVEPNGVEPNFDVLA